MPLFLKVGEFFRIKQRLNLARESIDVVIKSLRLRPASHLSLARRSLQPSPHIRFQMRLKRR